MLFSFSRIGYVPSLLFQLAPLPLPKGKWGIRLPLAGFYWQTGKPGHESDWQGVYDGNVSDAVIIPLSLHPPVQARKHQ